MESAVNVPPGCSEVGADSRRARKTYARSAVTNGRRLHVVPVGDNAWSRRFRDVLGQIIADLGGPDGLSEGQRQLARRAATLSMECERLEVRAVAGRSMLFEDGQGRHGQNGPTALEILQEAAKVLHALARYRMGGTSIAAVSELSRDEQDRVADLLTRASDIAAKAHIAGGQVIDLEVYGVLCDRLNRVFVRLGLERKPRDVTNLQDHIATIEAEQAEAEQVDEIEEVVP
jgi:hypothetical protein